MTTIDELREAVVDGQAKVAVAKVGEGLAEGTEAGTLLRDGLIAGMGQVGQLYEEGEIFVPEMLVAARAMAAALKVLKPYLVELQRQGGDRHHAGRLARHRQELGGHDARGFGL